MHTSSRPSAATCCESRCPRFVSTLKEPAVHREQAVRAAKAAQTVAPLKTVVRVKIAVRVKIRVHQARSAMRREARPELMLAAADRAHPAHQAGAHRYGCFVTASWFRCGCTPVSTMEH